MHPSDDQLADLSRIVRDTAEHEIDCAELLNRVAAYLNAVTTRAPVGERLQQVAQHLKVCPECHEEFVALIRAQGLDPRTLL